MSVWSNIFLRLIVILHNYMFAKQSVAWTLNLENEYVLQDT